MLAEANYTTLDADNYGDVMNSFVDDWKKGESVWVISAMLKSTQTKFRTVVLGFAGNKQIIYELNWDGISGLTAE